MRKLPSLPGYRVTGIIGRGGMGTVYRAIQIGMERLVAIKVLRPDLSRDRLYVDRLQREARVAGRLDHPHIVKGIEVGERDGRHYFVMEYVEGKSLRTILRERGKLEEEEVLDLGTQIARALLHAHGAGIIHRDVKPGNILIGPDGMAKLTDLGLARGPEDPVLTRDGATVGTPQYMSPEQARNPEDVDRRSDIYSLGATLFHAATGEPPFQAEGIGQLITKVLQDPAPDPAVLIPEISEGLSLVIRKALGKTPAQRYGSAQAMLSDLKRVENHLPPRVKERQLDEEDARWGLRLAILGGVLMVLALAFVFVLDLLGGRGEGASEAGGARPGASGGASEGNAPNAFAGADLGHTLANYHHLCEVIDQLRREGGENPDKRIEKLEETRTRLEREVLEPCFRRASKQALEAARASLERDGWVALPSKELERIWHAALGDVFGRPSRDLPFSLEPIATVWWRALEKAYREKVAAALDHRVEEIVAQFERSCSSENEEIYGAFMQGRLLDVIRWGDHQRDALEASIKALPRRVQETLRSRLDRHLEAFQAAVVVEGRKRVRYALTQLEEARVELESSADPLRRRESLLRGMEQRVGEILESAYLETSSQIPVGSRGDPPRDPFQEARRLLGQARAQLVQLLEDKALRSWERLKVHLDGWVARRRYRLALSALDTERHDSIQSALQAIEERSSVVRRLVAIEAQFAARLRAAAAAGEPVVLRLRGAGRPRPVKGIPILAAGAAEPLDLEERGFSLANSRRRILLRELDAQSLAPQSAFERALILFADGLIFAAGGVKPDHEAMLEYIAQVKTEDVTMSLVLHGWLEESTRIYEQRSEKVRRAIEEQLAEVQRHQAARRWEDALRLLAALEDEYRGKPALLEREEQIDALAEELRKAYATTRIADLIHERVASARVQGDVRSARITTTLDLRDPEVIADLGLDQVDGWSPDRNQGLHPITRARSVRDLDRAPSIDLQFGKTHLDFGKPVRIEVVLRCSYDEGVPFFTCLRLGDWTIGLFSGGLRLVSSIGPASGLPPGFVKDWSWLASKSRVAGRRGAVFLTRGRRLSSILAVVPERERGIEKKHVWISPWDGFLRGSEHRVSLVIRDERKRLQLFIDGQPRPLLDAHPVKIRRLSLAIHSWDRIHFTQLSLEGNYR